MCGSEVKAAVQQTINGTADRTSFQENLSYRTILSSQWPICAKIATKGSERPLSVNTFEHGAVKLLWLRW